MEDLSSIIDLSVFAQAAELKSNSKSVSLAQRRHLSYEVKTPNTDVVLSQ